ncbi:MAG TPA: hypothetical protein VKR32_19155 [Puia sp.]|nr:hypothetical protein [Puia sp.]
MNFFQELRRRNAMLFYLGMFCVLGAATCLACIYLTNTQVLGINAFIKPSKFFLSIAIITLTLAWLLYYLDNQKAVRRYSRATIVAMLIELVIITEQAARGQRSHFNNSPALNGILFGVMGASITVFTCWTAYMCWLFFKQKKFSIKESYLWGIRLGLLCFVAFAAEGFVIVHNGGHTVGAPDGGSGLPYLNWSTGYGDLRAAHFFGMHSLQILPILGYFFLNNKKSVIAIAIIYFAAVSLLLLEALNARPLI